MYAFGQANSADEPFPAKLLTFFFITLVWVLISCGVPHLFLIMYANRVWKLEEARYWDEYYQEKVEVGELETALSPREEASRLQKARNFEKALRFEEAALLYEDCGLWEEAGRARLRDIELSTPWWNFKGPGVHIDRSIHIENSVVIRSVIGGEKF